MTLLFTLIPLLVLAFAVYISFTLISQEEVKPKPSTGLFSFKSPLRAA